MRFRADFHIHSHYSRATTEQLTPENLDYWSRLKGLHVVGTGDCVHPGWLRELGDKLEPAGDGLYRLKPSLQLSAVTETRLRDEAVRFLLTTEISSIYKKAGKVRKVHNICVLPDLDAAQRFHARLAAIGNVKSDGRPILGLDAKLVLEILLESAPGGYLIPAHIWTPWFAVLGSQSGFDSLRECFDDLTGEIFAVETGLSSDPPMNRLCSFLDGVRLVSNSDAHSPEKLGREANLFDAELSYAGIRDALKRDEGFVGTIEFFPQEGKYHFDGHRQCGIRWDPLTTLEHRGRCSACGKPVTRGVLYRVAQLADRADPVPFYGKQRHWSITPLPQLLSEMMSLKSSSGQAVRREYLRLLDQLGSEFHILLDADLARIREVGGERLAEGIRRLRAGEVRTEPGFDGEFGTVRVFTPEELRDARGVSLFAASGAETRLAPATTSVEVDIAEFQRRQRTRSADVVGEASRGDSSTGIDEQRETIEFGAGVCVVLAGPGAGKTRTLTERIATLVERGTAAPSEILAVTFSNKAAEEIRRRLADRLPRTDGLTVTTFHALGLSILREHAARLGRSPDFSIVDDDERRALVAEAAGTSPALRAIEAIKQGRAEPAATTAPVFNRYEQLLTDRQAVDLDDLISLPVRLLREHSDVLAACRERFRWILVDEFQDLNARQYEFIRLLAGDDANLFAIGDPDQAIYGFRGSDARLIDQLQRDYPHARVVRLKRSFRCPAPVLRGAGQILDKPDVLDGRALDVKIHIQRCLSDRAEAEWIASQIERMIGGVASVSMHRQTSDGREAEGITSFGDFAIFCRTSSLFGPLTDALAQHGIAYQVVGQEPFYREEPWRSAIRRLRAAAHDPSPDATVAPLLAQARPVGDVMRALMKDVEIAPFDWECFDRFASGFDARYADFLRAVAMRQPVDDLEAKAERVSVMTMHASKGLEFPVVFIPGCEDGLVPWNPSGKAGADELAEEARLFYVAMTRTKHHVFLSHAAKRAWRGRVVTPARSPLLDRIERDLLELAKQIARPTDRDTHTQLSLWK